MPAPPPRELLLTPGPTPVPPDVVAAMARPLPHHRTREFKALFGSVLERLKPVFRTERDVMLFTSSGTGAFESAYANLVSPGDRVLVVSAGNFGERWIKMAQAYGASVETLRWAWGERPDPDAIAEVVSGRERPRAGGGRPLRDLDRVGARPAGRGGAHARPLGPARRRRHLLASARPRWRPTPGASTSS